MKKTNGSIVDCAVFQEQLPSLFESGDDQRGLEHLETCENCSALVRDLLAIAEAGKLLLPLHDPSPAVWENIQDALKKEPSPTE